MYDNGGGATERAWVGLRLRESVHVQVAARILNTKQRTGNAQATLLFPHLVESLGGEVSVRACTNGIQIL